MRLGRRVLAGLALHKDALFYVELGPSGLMRQESIPFGGLGDSGRLEEAFDALRKRLGRFNGPVVLGVDDARLKWIQYPRMPLEDARAALALDFEQHFPYPWEEAAVDVLEAGFPEEREALLAAVMRKARAEALLRAAERARLPVAAVELIPIAFFRAMTAWAPWEGGGYMAVNDDGEALHILVGHRGDVLFFRSVPSAQALPRVQETLDFMKSRCGGLALSRLFAPAPLARELRELSLDMVEVEVGEAWRLPLLENASPFAQALGLALRDRAPRFLLDLRPAEGRRPMAFSRFAAALLALLFPVLCGGCMAADLARALALRSEVAERQRAVGELEGQRDILMARLAQLRERESRLMFLADRPALLEVLDVLEARAAAGVELRGLQLAPPEWGRAEQSVTVEAAAEGETQLLAWADELRQSGLFTDVTVSYAERRGPHVHFTLRLALRPLGDAVAAQGTAP